VNCDEVRELLPDHTLGTLTETEALAVRRHLRGCAACRADAERLDHGVALFAAAAHETDPPPELKDRVMRVLTKEWAEPATPPAGSRRRILSGRSFALLAAAFVLLAGALAWGATAQSTANGFREDAASYNRFLHALGGKDVRVATLKPLETRNVTGSAVLYDSDVGQSWVLVLVRTTGLSGTVNVSLLRSRGAAIALHPITLDADGEGATWLVTSSDISAFGTVRLTDASGRPLATGVAVHAEHD
jgi:hypothetical protein